MRIFLVDPKTDEVKVIELPSGFEDFKTDLMKKYPNNAAEIENFLDYSRAMYLELFKLKVEPKISEILKMLFTCPKIVKNASKTFEKYFEQFKITEPDVIEIFNIFAEFSGLPADRIMGQERCEKFRGFPRSRRMRPCNTRAVFHAPGKGCRPAVFLDHNRRAGLLPVLVQAG